VAHILKIVNSSWFCFIFAKCYGGFRWERFVDELSFEAEMNSVTV